MKRDIVIFLLIDALGWEWIKERPFLEDIAVCRRPTRTILGFSCGAIPSILTGKFPVDHGRWNLLYYSPDTSPFRWTRNLRFLPRFMLENRVARKVINVISKRLSGSEGYFSSYGLPADKLYLFDLCEKENIYRPGGVPGSTTILDYLQDYDIAYRSYSYHQYGDSEILRMLQDDIQDGTENIYFAYLAEIDAYLHEHCHEKDLVNAKLDWLEAQIRQVFSAALAQSDNARLFVFSDHGMTPIVHHFNLVGELLGNGINLDTDCIAVFDSTMARFWAEGAARENIVRMLNSCSAGRVLDTNELQDLGVYFPDGRYGNIVFLMNPGTLIFPNGFGKYSPKGMHGFDPLDIHSYGSYLSSVPDYQPEQITDLFSVMKHEADRVMGKLVDG